MKGDEIAEASRLWKVSKKDNEKLQRSTWKGFTHAAIHIRLFVDEIAEAPQLRKSRERAATRLPLKDLGKALLTKHLPA